MDAHDAALGSFLLDAGLLSRAALADVYAGVGEVSGSLSARLVAVGALSEDEVRRAEARVLGIPFVELAEAAIDAAALSLLPEPFCRAQGLVAYAMSKEKGVRGPVLEVACLDHAAHAALAQLRLPGEVRLRLTSRASLARALLLYQKTLRESFGAHATEGAAVLDVLLARALHSRAEAALLSPIQEGGFLLQYRIAGVLYDAMTLPGAVGGEVLAQVKTLARLAGALPQSGMFRILPEGGSEVSVRARVLGTVSGESLLLSLSETGAAVSLESLGLQGAALEGLQRALALRRGLVLVAGEGQGAAQREFLYTLLSQVVGHTHTSMTVEARVVRRVPQALQTEIGERSSCAGAVRAALLHEPAVLMVSEIADRETALLLIEAADRGVFVLAGISAPSAAAGVAALLGYGVSSARAAAVLAAVVATTSVRALCPACREHGVSYTLSRAEMVSLEREVDFSRVLTALKEDGACAQECLWRDVSFLQPHGCAECLGGYQGRLFLQEVWQSTLTLQDAVRAGAGPAELEVLAREAGALTLLEDGIYKAAQGQTSLDALLAIEAEREA